jgi:hypothetical protein
MASIVAVAILAFPAVRALSDPWDEKALSLVRSAGREEGEWK